MRIALYLNSAENNRVDKTGFLSLLLEVEGFLRESTDIVNPRIYLELPTESGSLLIDEDNEEIEDADGFAIVSGDDAVLRCNYAYIPEFHRYYFVSNITIKNKTLYTLSLSCDELMSFKDYFLGLEALIDRNEFDYNPLADDSLMPFELDEDVEIVYPESIAPEGSLTEFLSDWDIHDRNILLNAINDDVEIPQGITAPEGTNLPAISDSFAVDSGIVYAISPLNLIWVSRAVMNNDNLNTYVKSIIAFPYLIPNLKNASQANVRLGTTDISLRGSTARKSFSNISPYIEVARFTMPTASDYRDYRPYTNIELFVPFLGFVEMENKIVAGHDISLYYSVSYEDGTAEVYIHDLTTNTPIHVAQCQLGVKLALDATNNTEITNQRIASITNGVLGFIGGGVSLGIGTATRSPLTIASGAMGMAHSIADIFNKNAMLYDRAQVGYSTGLGSLYSPLVPFLRYRRKKAMITDGDAYRHQYGAPLQGFRTLSDLTGFTTIASIHLEEVPAFSSELSAIEGLLKSGVIF